MADRNVTVHLNVDMTEYRAAMKEATALTNQFRRATKRARKEQRKLGEEVDA